MVPNKFDSRIGDWIWFFENSDFELDLGLFGFSIFDSKRFLGLNSRDSNLCKFFIDSFYKMRINKFS